MRIAFDGTTLTAGRTGVGYYTEHLLQHLAREVEKTGDELIVISNQPIETARPLPPHVHVHTRSYFPVRIAWMQLLAARVLDDVRADVAHFTNGMLPIGSEAVRVVTIHDMSLKLFPWCHPTRRLMINRPLLGVAARLADAVVTVSHSARRDLMRFHRLPAQRVSVVHEAAGPEFVPIADPAWRARIRRRYGLPDRFALYVGAIEPRKNLPRLMDAFALARAQGIPHDLVCVGPYGWSSRDLYQQVDDLGLGRIVHFTGYVPVEDLPVIYNLAEFFLFPSLYEGFGLPVVEAMACGTPVITANSSSLVEIAAGAAETVDPHDTRALAAKIVALASDRGRQEHFRQRGLERAREFSWTRTAQQMLAIYARAAGITVPREAPSTARPELDGKVAVEPISREATL
jgi:glycosyltransferase involved in cell wall biosynthesis